MIISAVDFEVRPLLDKLALSGRNTPAFYTGIGALEAAASARELASAAVDASVIYVGTAGTFGNFVEPWLCTSQRVCWLPSGDRAGISYGIPPGKLSCETLSPDPALGLPSKTIICSPSVSLSREFSQTWKNHLIAEDCIENLELWSCIRQLKQKAKCVNVIMGITNQVGSDAHEQWKKWHPLVAEMTASHVMRWLDEN